MDNFFRILCDKYDRYVEVSLPGVNCMYWPGPPEQTKGKEKDLHLPENNDKELYEAERIMNGQEPFLNQGLQKVVCYLPCASKESFNSFPVAGKHRTCIKSTSTTTHLYSRGCINL